MVDHREFWYRNVTPINDFPTVGLMDHSLISESEREEPGETGMDE